jgi:hypothetical protein
MWVMSNLVSVRLEMVLVSVQDGAWFAPNVEIILDAPDGSPWSRGSICLFPSV